MVIIVPNGNIYGMNNILFMCTLQFEHPSSDSQIINFANNFLNQDNFPFVVFNITEQGPNVTFKDVQSELLSSSDHHIDDFLLSLAIAYISAIGNGQNYTTGVFDLPAGNLKDYRMMLISVYVNGAEGLDTLFHQNYIQIGIFIPIELMKMMPSLSSIEQLITDTINYNILSLWDLTDETYRKIKNDLMTIIFLSIINQNLT